MDDVDRALLDELQRDARLPYSELSRRVHLSPPAVAERVRRLEETGVLTGYHAHVDPARAGWDVTAVVRMWCRPPHCVLREPEIHGWPEVLSIDRVTGDCCCILRIVASSMRHFELLIDRLAPYGQPSSTMVLSSPVQWKPISTAPAHDTIELDLAAAHAHPTHPAH